MTGTATGDGGPAATAPSPAGSDLLGEVLAGRVTAFAVMHRPQANASGRLEVMVGTTTTAETLAGLAQARRPRAAAPCHEAVALIPYRQIAERGYACVDDGEPLIVLRVTGQADYTVTEALRRLPDVPIQISGGRFDVDDDTYADLVRSVVTNEIGTGEGANFVIRRSFVTEITDFGPAAALTLFRRLLERETGAYWTYLLHTGTRTFVGATPERHISVQGGRAVMNPISGTYRYPPSGPTLRGVMDFLSDAKETEELYMVVDEELKMMGRICDAGGRVVGPFLKEMAHVAHTEYFIEGHTSRDVPEILHKTMFAPTVTGSPLENACKVISRHEVGGRGYYSGVIALIGRDEAGERSLDSAIVIRTADIDQSGQVRIGVGATLVRDSDPASEVAETRAKAAGMLAALTGGPARFGDHPGVRAALADRNKTIAGFWLADGSGAGGRPSSPLLAGRSILIIDAEDAFTSMIGHMLRALGAAVAIRRFDEPYSFDGHDAVIMGPGPGDPRAYAHPKISHLGSAMDALLAGERPFLAVCLSHQVLADRLGFGLDRLPVPHQGLQKEIDLFGTRERVGFYNTFAAWSREDKVECPGTGIVEVARDAETGEVHALRGPHFASIQFHAESILTQGGERIIGDLLSRLLPAGRAGAPDHDVRGAR